MVMRLQARRGQKRLSWDTIKSGGPVVACLVSQLFCASAASGQAPRSSSPKPPPSSNTPPSPEPTRPSATSPQSTRSREAWAATIRSIRPPKKGCFTATYPSTEWKEVACVTPPQRPYPPARRALPQIIGGTTYGDAAAVVTPLITAATGSFDSATVTTETGPTYGPGCSVSNPNAPDTFSLQLNSGFFMTPACPSTNSACFGWQQFVYSNSGSVFIQYWLGSYGSCPAGWTNAGGGNCYFTAPGASVSPQSATNLAQLTLHGAAGAAGDTVTLTVGNVAHASSPQSPTPFLNLAQGWNTVEFNVLGDGCASQATFGNGTTIVGRTSIVDGSQKAPSCTTVKNTGETNNLYWGPAAPARSGTPPALLFAESSNGANTASACATATSVGDTHLATFDGLLYDFQASGDFVLVRADRDFVVQTRQMSGAPSWPNAATNTAVAMKVGETRVAICLNPTRLEVDGKPREVNDGKSLSLAGGVDIFHKGDVYVVASKGGDSVQATLNNNGLNSWIDVAVGLGHSPQTSLSGLLANAPGNIHAITERNGTVLNLPVSFDDLYHPYADSWRVAPGESLLCKDSNVEVGIPEKPMYASDLNKAQAKRAREICVDSGVKGKALLEACMLDVTVLGQKKAADVFVRQPAPVAVMPSPVGKHPEPGH